MSRYVYVSINVGGKIEKPPSDFGAKLSVNGHMTDISKYEIEFDIDSGDYPLDARIICG